MNGRTDSRRRHEEEADKSETTRGRAGEEDKPRRERSSRRGEHYKVNMRNYREKGDKRDEQNEERAAARGERGGRRAAISRDKGPLAARKTQRCGRWESRGTKERDEE